MFVTFNRLRYQSKPLVSLNHSPLIQSLYIGAHGTLMSHTFRYAIVHRHIVYRLFYLLVCRTFNCDDS